MAGAKRNTWMLVVGVPAAGAAAIYFLDRERGQARRAAFASKTRRLGTDVARRSSQVRARQLASSVSPTLTIALRELSNSTLPVTVTIPSSTVALTFWYSLRLPRTLSVAELICWS